MAFFVVFSTARFHGDLNACLGVCFRYEYIRLPICVFWPLSCPYLFARFLYLTAIKKYSNSLPGVSTEDSYGTDACDLLILDCAVIPNKLESATLDRWKVCLGYNPDTCTNAPMGFISFQMQLR